MSEFWLEGDEWDLGYRNLRDGENSYCQTARKILEEYWKNYHSYADENFCVEFARNPDNRFWEMYLTNILLESGKNVVPRADRPHDGPDILIDEAGRRIWIEAITFGPGAEGHPDRVPPLKFDGQAHSAPNQQIELRISGAFMEKYRKFVQYAEKLVVSSEDIKMIAINPGKTSVLSRYDGRGSPMTVLYPLGDQYVTFYKDSDHSDTGYHYREEIEKATGAVVNIGMFASDAHSEITACVYSCTTLGNVGFGGKGVAIYHNCFPRNALRFRWMRWDMEWGCRQSEDRCELFHA